MKNRVHFMLRDNTLKSLKALKARYDLPAGTIIDMLVADYIASEEAPDRNPRHVLGDVVRPARR